MEAVYITVNSGLSLQPPFSHVGLCIDTTGALSIASLPQRQKRKESRTEDLVWPRAGGQLFLKLKADHLKTDLKYS